MSQPARFIHKVFLEVPFHGAICKVVVARFCEPFVDWGLSPAPHGYPRSHRERDVIVRFTKLRNPLVGRYSVSSCSYCGVLPHSDAVFTMSISFQG